MHVLLAASECAPFFKTGGLGDVVGSLPFEFASKGIKTSVVLPLHHENIEDLKFKCYYDIYIGQTKYHCGVFYKKVDQVNFYFIDNKQFFCRSNLYGYDDDILRYAYFDFAVLELISHLKLDINILHLHDWQTAMIATLYKERYFQYPLYQNIKIVLTIHNIAFQGKCSPKGIMDYFDLPFELYTNGNVRNDDCFNMMKAGIVYSDYITTVSPSYANEIMSDYYGEGLQYILRTKKYHVVGILNGIDLKQYCPDFTIDSLFIKENHKMVLQKHCNLEVCKDIPIISMITRLTNQKGIDLVIDLLPNILKQNIQVVILGSGDSGYENKLNELAYCYSNLHVTIGYNEQYAKQIYASSDMFLMPSLFEPCGLAQMMAMRYGTIPIVRKTGGLQDTVFPYYDGIGTGFVFDNYNYESLNNIVYQAIDLYHNKTEWYRLVDNAMKQVFDFNKSSKNYIKLFKKMT